MEPTAQTSAALGGASVVMVAGYFIFGLISFICWIKVLIALFKKEGVGLGILGILCAIFAFIWGWIKSTELGLKKTMIWWTLSIVGMVVVGGVVGATAATALANDPGFRKQMQEAQRQAQEQQAAPAPAPTPAPQ